MHQSCLLQFEGQSTAAWLVLLPARGLASCPRSTCRNDRKDGDGDCRATSDVYVASTKIWKNSRLKLFSHAVS